MKTTFALLSTLLLGSLTHAQTTAPSKPWEVGTPIVTYWCGPTLTDTVAQQMKEGGYNLVWCGQAQLEVAERHGLRAMLTDTLLSPASLDNPERREALDALISKVRNHPALYAYYIIDEPSAAQFPELGRLTAYLQEHDPGHLAYINLFPTYANNQQLGTQGDTITAYKEHLRQYVDIVKPDLISYDHYQFMKAGENQEYFLNLAMIRQSALDAGKPFLNIVQASSWAPSVRVPTTDEMRYLVYTTLAYGAQGISYYIYCCPRHEGGIALADGTPTPIYHALKEHNPAFVAIASILQPLESLSVVHTSMQQPGCIPPPADFPVQVTNASNQERGFLIGLFGRQQEASHGIIVNLDGNNPQTARLSVPDPVERFDPQTKTWQPQATTTLDLQFLPGEGILFRK